MLKADIKSNLNFPKIVLKEDLRYIANRIFIPILQNNIERQVTLTGGRFPSLEKKTMIDKAKKGQGTKTLIATKTLLRSFIALDRGPSTVKIFLHPQRAAIGGYLQLTGIKTKRTTKFFNFFGISKFMEARAMEYMIKRVKEIFKNARSK